MSKQFNVGDNVKYIGPYSSRLLNTIGVVKTVDIGRYYIRSNVIVGYFIEWSDGESSWLSGCNLSLVTPEVTIKSAKELKAELESEILRLVQDFNKKTDLQIKDIDLDRERTLGGDCFYRVNVKVEI